MEPLGTILFLLLAVVVSGKVARLTRAPLPLVQIGLGVAVALSVVPTVTLDPELFFVLFLPPLLFLDGWRIPKDHLLRDRGTIVELALGLVILTVLGVGLFIHWLIPGMPLPVAFALAAVVSPTDPIAVSAICARARIPKRMMHILEGESLLNDASGLVCMRFAIAAMLTGSFSIQQAIGSFLWIALGGLAIGIALTWLISRGMTWLAMQLGEDTSAPYSYDWTAVAAGSYSLTAKGRAARAEWGQATERHACRRVSRATGCKPRASTLGRCLRCAWRRER